MKKGLLITIIVLIVVVAAGIGGYLYLTSSTKGPSAMTPPPAAPAEGEKKAPAPLTEPNAGMPESVTATKDQTKYSIVSASSSATFALDEMLRGQPKTVVGTSTAAIYGEIAVNTHNLASSTMGTILLNARTFVTDENGRNNMIRRSILKTEDDANEFIAFKATSLKNLAADFGEQDEFWMDITGDLTIAGVTKPATFRSMVMINVDGTLTARATTTVKRDDFGLVIPSIPFIADVENAVDLQLNIVALPKI